MSASDYSTDVADAVETLRRAGLHTAAGLIEMLAADRDELRATLRDEFAAKAMQGFVSSYPRGELTCQMDDIAEDAYMQADAMLRARSQP